MPISNSPKQLARIAGFFYLVITLSAMFAYLYVRARLVGPTDMVATVRNLAQNEQLYRAGFSSAVITVVCNLPLGVLLYELLKVVQPRVAFLALAFIIVSTTIEAMNLVNYIAPLFTVTLPEYRSAFDPAQLQALARGPVKLFGTVFSISLTFFGGFCMLNGYLIFRSGFLPRIIGLLMIATGLSYWANSFSAFLSGPDLSVLFRLTFVSENALALWLLIVGLNAPKWHERAAQF